MTKTLAEMMKRVEPGRNGRTVLLEGPTGTGKTTQYRYLVAGVPELKLAGFKVLLVSSERKLTSLDDLTLDPITIMDYGYPDPTVPEECDQYLNSASANFYQVVHQLRTTEHEFDVLFVDSLMRLLLKMLWQIGATNTNPDKRSDYAIFKRKALNLLDQFGSLSDATVTKRPVHVVATTGVENEVDQLDGGRKQQAAIEGTKVAPLIGHYFDDVFMLRTRPGPPDASGNPTTVYLAHTQANPLFDSKVSGLTKLPPVIENFNLFRVIKKMRGEL